MELNVENFILINVGVLLLIVLYMFLGRSRKSPAKLKFSNENVSQDNPKLAPKSPAKSEPLSVNKPDEEERMLTIYFQFNGHSFEAYETLGLPAGASVSQAKVAFESILAEKGSGVEADFYRLALNAIEKSYQ